jgi:ferric-dicitrate binding protein FerR (iron transport regulator)
MDKELLKKFVRNQCTSDEVDAVFDWIRQTDRLSGEALLKDYWDEIKFSDSMDEVLVRQRLDRIHHQINLNQAEQMDSAIPRFLPVKKYSLVQLVSRVAAILLIPVITLLIYTRLFQSGPDQISGYTQLNEIISPPGSRTFLELSDGTKVWLNHESKMIYPQRFTGKTRTVQLVGEGYFEVATNKAKPFIVESNGIAVKAVGTQFNVKAYRDDPNFETTLESGKVLIMKKTSGEGSKEICEMSPGQHLVFDHATNQYSLSTEDLSKYVSWKEGKLVFKDDDLDQVAERLSRWYNVEIILKDSEIKKFKYTATFVDESLYQILEMLEIVSPISYTFSERQKMPDGTFSKKEILIHKRMTN